jgi:hypothetical protein
MRNDAGVALHHEPKTENDGGKKRDCVDDCQDDENARQGIVSVRMLTKLGYGAAHRAACGPSGVGLE